jgi:hypothetical protein
MTATPWVSGATDTVTALPGAVVSGSDVALNVGGSESASRGGENGCRGVTGGSLGALVDGLTGGFWPVRARTGNTNAPESAIGCPPSVTDAAPHRSRVGPGTASGGTRVRANQRRGELWQMPPRSFGKNARHSTIDTPGRSEAKASTTSSPGYAFAGWTVTAISEVSASTNRRSSPFARPVVSPGRVLE